MCSPIQLAARPGSKTIESAVARSVRLMHNRDGRAQADGYKWSPSREFCRTLVAQRQKEVLSGYANINLRHSNPSHPSARERDDEKVGRLSLPFALRACV